jgi:hypothetical protein
MLVVLIVVIVKARVGDCATVIVARFRCLTPGIAVLS